MLCTNPSIQRQLPEFRVLLDGFLKLAGKPARNENKHCQDSQDRPKSITWHQQATSQEKYVRMGCFFGAIKPQGRHRGSQPIATARSNKPVQDLQVWSRRIAIIAIAVTIVPAFIPHADEIQ
ncbi:hypothetical protein EJ05DRAFT_499272 [Pseudovirgaria hyperparasitica]|uniref:Uncharacterized protein n=1 Tax=Pseudovirgaria hyperparasitica TaxID=470096 RepID=A0A6A6W7G8_9PEZI|nr:uncharacterized protein EJ05DRAFT_499272 [Pseudovirgaria hyperparasitica]KAF2758838.1 hypothetical protein EJ05DRAFT_499272 [Pseudovirgaria hyperparasitica]